MAEQYTVKCWHCQADFDAYSAPSCSHSTPTKICPFCLKCFCDATDDYKDRFVKNCPKELLAEFMTAHDSLIFKIGEILLKAGKISVEQLDAALKQQKVSSKKLGEVLIMMSLITPHELELYLLNQKNIEKIDLKNVEIDMALVRQIGKEFCLQHEFIPIEIQEIAGGQVLQFAIHSLNELAKLKKSAELRNFKLIPYLGQKEDIENMLKNLRNTDKDSKTYSSLKGTKQIGILNSLVKSALLGRVSAILFEFKAGQLGVFFRSGELLSRVNPPIDDAKDFFVKLKEVCGIKTEPRNTAQKSWLSLNKKLNYLQIRVSYYASPGQENIRLKFNNLKDFSKRIANLNLQPDEVELLQTVLQSLNGLFIVAGPANSKVDETLYALMHTLTKERIATVETDVVLRNERFFQIENEGSEVSDDVYKNLLFFKPDSMFLFDYLQKNFDRQFLNFVELGKLFIQLQGFSYEEIFEKMQYECEVPFSCLAKNLRMVIFQRQVKILCSHCKQPHPLSARELYKSIQLSNDYQIFQEKGCPKCQSSGYSRDEIFYEIFVLPNHERPLFKQENLAGLGKKISEAGHLTIAQKVLNRALKGEVSFKESSRFF